MKLDIKTLDIKRLKQSISEEMDKAMNIYDSYREYEYALRDLYSALENVEYAKENL